jgi:hypothetical protein
MLLNMTVCGKAIHPIAGFADVLFGNSEVTPPGYHQSRTAFLEFPLPIISTFLSILDTSKRYRGANTSSRRDRPRRMPTKAAFKFRK